MMNRSLPMTILALCLLPLGAGAESDRQAHGRQVYQAQCAQCHETGIRGVPQVDQPADWERRSELWEAVLFEHAEKGYLGMPAQSGGNGASEFDVNAAAEYMLNTIYPDRPHD